MQLVIMDLLQKGSIMARSICEVEGCEKYVVTHGLCDMHRKRLVRHGHLEPTRPSDWGKREKHPLYQTWMTKVRWDKKHSLCDDWSKDFWRFVKDVKGRPSPDHHLRPIDEDLPIGPENWHWVLVVPDRRGCEDAKAYQRAWCREDRARNPEKYRCKQFQRQYGITLEKYNEMSEIQGHVCAICSKPETALNPRTKKPRSLAVDHCHNSSKVRGLLCAACNTALGGFKDDTELLNKAIEYLKRTTNASK